MNFIVFKLYLNEAVKKPTNPKTIGPELSPREVVKLMNREDFLSSSSQFRI